jgi:hypothetical protein
MKFLQFPLFRPELLAVLLLLAGAPAMAADDDLPPPSNGEVEEMPSLADPAPQDSVDDAMPAPSLGSESLPEPTVGAEVESPQNQVNKLESTDDNIFLPSPSGGDDIGMAPLGPVGGNVVSSSIDSEWKSSLSKRPIFTFLGGVGLRNYATTAVPDLVTGYSVGTSIRVWDLGQTLFLHGLAGFTYFPIGTVGAYPDVHDKTYHLGGMLELAIGRRISIFGSFLQRRNFITFAPAKTDVERVQRSPTQLQYIGEKPKWQLGLGVQYDFYVVPHGSLGIMGRIERDMTMILLTMAIEPAPRKRLSLNFESMNP